MAKCPKCGAELTELDAIVKEKNLYTYRGGDWQHRENIEFDVDYYKCPECYTPLRISDADEFLAGNERARLPRKPKSSKPKRRRTSPGNSIQGLN